MTANAKARSTEQTAQAKNVRTSRSTSPTERPQKKSSATEEIQANAAHLATKTMHTKTQQNAAHRSHGGAAVAGLTEALAAFSTAAQHRMPWRNACAAHWSQWPPKGRGARRLKASSRSSTKGAQAAALWGGQRVRALPHAQQLRHPRKAGAETRQMSPCELCCPQYIACDRPANAVCTAPASPARYAAWKGG